MGILEKIGNAISGKKAYVTMILTFVVGGLMANGIEIPDFAWVVLGGMGLGSIRSAIGKVEKPNA